MMVPTGQGAINGLGVVLAISLLLNLVQLFDRVYRRRSQVAPMPDKSSKPRKPTRRERRAAAKYAAKQAAEQRAIEQEAAAREARADEREAMGAAWAGDNARLSMMEQAAAFAAMGEVAEVPVIEKPKPKVAPKILPPMVATPYTGATRTSNLQPYAQFTRAMSKRQVTNRTQSSSRVAAAPTLVSTNKIVDFLAS